MSMLAAAAHHDTAGRFLTLAFLFGVGYVVVSPFFRRIGGKGGGSDKDSFGAWLLAAAIFVGILVATR